MVIYLNDDCIPCAEIDVWLQNGYVETGCLFCFLECGPPHVQFSYGGSGRPKLMKFGKSVNLVSDNYLVTQFFSLGVFWVNQIPEDNKPGQSDP